MKTNESCRKEIVLCEPAYLVGLECIYGIHKYIITEKKNIFPARRNSLLHGGHPASCFKQLNMERVKWSFSKLDDGRPWTDLDSWYAHEADGPYKIHVNNSTTSSGVGNIQRESSRVLSRSPWETWNFKKVAHVVWFVVLFVSSFVYCRGQWPGTPVCSTSKLRDLVVQVLFFYTREHCSIMLREQCNDAVYPLCCLRHWRFLQYIFSKLCLNMQIHPEIQIRCYVCAYKIAALTPEQKLAPCSIRRRGSFNKIFRLA